MLRSPPTSRKSLIVGSHSFFSPGRNCLVSGVAKCLNERLQEHVLVGFGFRFFNAAAIFGSWVFTAMLSADFTLKCSALDEGQTPIHYWMQ